MKTHVVLIGEQPIPNLLPLRYYQPDAVVAVYSSRTEKAYHRLTSLVDRNIRLIPLLVDDAYDIFAIQEALRKTVQATEIAAGERTFNFTGGTKPMSLAAYLVAEALGVPMVYVESERKATRCYEYQFVGGHPALIQKLTIPGVITIKDYLMAHTGQGVHERRTQAEDVGHAFELAIYNALQPPVVDEIVCAACLDDTVDIDLIVRCANQVAVIEAKTGLNGIKKAVDQLDTIGEQRYLGTYTGKILVSDQNLRGRSNILSLAEKQRITVVELPGYGENRVLNLEETQKLQAAILNVLGKTA